MADTICPVISHKIRSDSAGDGHYGALRGTRKHRGIDLLSHVGEQVRSPITGVISRIGYAYQIDRLRDKNYVYRIVRVKNDDITIEMFYIDPDVCTGDEVKIGQIIGRTQDLSIQYPHLPEMRNHMHLQIKDKDGKIINPMNIYEGVIT